MQTYLLTSYSITFSMMYLIILLLTHVLTASDRWTDPICQKHIMTLQIVVDG